MSPISSGPLRRITGARVDDKRAVHDFWNEASCGERLLLGGEAASHYNEQARLRYTLEPFIERFARFDDCRGWDVLEIGVGLGADHQRFAEAGARLKGIDLTERAVQHARHRLDQMGLASELTVGDAENLAFPSESFDVVYSWGVLHHSPGTAQAVSEAWRVLKPGGIARVMIYHKWSMVGFMLWGRYALMRLRPFTSLEEIYGRYLESPGTKAYSVEEARQLFGAFRDVSIETVLTHGDLLTSQAGQRHTGIALTLARVFWPRWFIRRVLPSNGLFMLITASK
jgi:ubiquinone/menaquinone biosynthesis C-methylase UbiE